jgi:DivIVA domain-containing protein
VSADAFHLTPLDVRKQEFRRSLRGYEPLGVEDFRGRVADELERILREKAVLEERVAALAEQLRAYRERERAMNEALVAAQQLREETRAGAQREAQVVVREAEAEAQRIIAAARAAQGEVERASSRRTSRASAPCSSASWRSSGHWTASRTDDRGRGPRGPGADDTRPRRRDHPRHRARGSRR